MGKVKGQRTKNNARPSNSSRSAEFLGATAPGFVGFTAAKDGGYVPVLPGLSITNNAELNTIDPSFQLVLKKMSKKDATTKYKALLEFSELCTNLELPLVEAMLPFWPRLYSSLSIDIDHRVREAAQLAHATLVKRVGKAIAIYLKQLAGPWFVAQYDIYPPAASAATNSFNNTFPPPKFISAIVHCQEEILNYISDNIIVLTPQGLSTNKSASPEEMESKYQKILTSSLQAYNFYLKTVTPADIEKTAEYHKKLINSNKFWKLAKNEDSTIKAAFFSALSALISYVNNIVCEEKKKVLTTIMNCLDESDPALLTAVWESLLVAINKIEDWYKVVSIEKLVLPKLYKVLKNGGQFAASVVYPNLLPFLSQFPKFDIDKMTLFTNFFENMRQGFSVKSVKFSRSEAYAVVTSFVECLKYAILVNKTNEEICKSLLKNQLMPVVEYCICNNQAMRPIFFCELSHLLRYWNKNSTNSEYSIYDELLKLFWSELACIFDRLVDEAADGQATSAIVCSTAELLEYLKNAPEHSRRNMKVKFSDAEAAPSLPLSTSSSLDETNPDNVSFLQQLRQLVIQLCIGYFRRIADKSLKHKVVDLVRIIAGHESSELFTALARTYNENANLLQFYNSNLKILLSADGVETAGALINLIFSIMMYMPDADKLKVLQSFEEMNDARILKFAVQCALTKKYREDKIVRNWCRDAVVTNTLIFTAQDVSANLKFSDFDEKIFIQAFEPALDGDLIVSNEAVFKISWLLCSTVDRMPYNSEKRAQKIASLLSHLLALSLTHKEINPGANELLKALFRLHIRDDVEQNEDDNKSTVVVVAREAWTKGLYEISKRIPEDAFVQHVKYFASIIWKTIFSINDVSKDSLISLSTDFIDAVTKSNERYTQNFVMMILTELEIKEWMKQVVGMICYGEVITGNLYVSELTLKSEVFDEMFDIDLCNANFQDHTHKCLKWAVVCTKILNNLLSNTADLPEIIEILINLSYAAALGEIYVEHYNSTQHSNEVNALRKILHGEFINLKTFLSEDVHNDVISDINRLLLSYGGVYSYVLKFYRDFFSPNNTLNELFENSPLDSSEKSYDIEIFLQLSQFQILNSCDSLNKLLSLLDDGNDFHKIFLACNQINQNETASLTEIFESVTKRQQTEPSTLFLDTDIHEASWKNFTLPLEVISFFTKCVTKVPTKLTIAQWDIIEICLASWNLSVKKSIDHHTDFKVKALIIAVSKLYAAIQQLLNDHAKRPIEDIPPSLLDEWKNVFASDLQVGAFETWMMFAELYNDRNIPVVAILPLNYLGKCLKVFDSPIIGNSPSESKGLSKTEDEIMQLLLKLIHSPVLNLQLSAYIALNNIIEVLGQRDKAIIEIENFDVKSLNICKFEEILKTAQNIVNTMLMDFKLCDTVSCTIQPYTDSYTYTIGYLFTWSVVLNMCAKANGDLRYHYAEILKDDYFPSLLNNIFRLMPVEVLQDTKTKNPKLVEIFCTTPVLDFTSCWTEWRLDHLVCWLYTNCLRYLPVLVRQWWSTTDSRVSAAVDKLTTLYVSPFLCNEELYDNRLTNVENMQVKVHPTSREVVAMYQMDDTTLELNIVLPPNHPLGTVTVEPQKYAGGTANWRNCHMTLSIFLTHQNGSIWDGLMLWKANLDKRFAGVEECYICFSIFHISTYQIPKLSCHTCRKKFHTPCLYKWFNTSHNSTCPICRNVF